MQSKGEGSNFQENAEFDLFLLLINAYNEDKSLFLN